MKKEHENEEKPIYKYTDDYFHCIEVFCNVLSWFSKSTDTTLWS